MTRSMAMIALVAGLAAPPFAQSPMPTRSPPPAAPAAACPADPAPLPPELAGFRSPKTVTAATGGAAGAVMMPGMAVTLALAPGGSVRYPVTPSRPGAAGTFGGYATLAVAKPGTYRIALSSGAWLDVAQKDALMTSVAHDHGPACSGVRKLVDFKLDAGSYAVEIAGNREPTITVLAALLP